MKRCDSNTWKLKKEFPCIIKSIRHDGNEMNIIVINEIPTTTFDKIINRLHKLKVKMYCIKEHLSEKILADERGKKC